MTEEQILNQKEANKLISKFRDSATFRQEDCNHPDSLAESEVGSRPPTLVTVDFFDISSDKKLFEVGKTYNITISN